MIGDHLLGSTSKHCSWLNLLRIPAIARLSTGWKMIAAKLRPRNISKRNIKDSVMNRASLAWMISQITDRERPRPSCVIMLVMFSKTLARLSKLGGPKTARAVLTFYAVKPREKSSNMTVI